MNDPRNPHNDPWAQRPTSPPTGPPTGPHNSYSQQWGSPAGSDAGGPPPPTSPYGEQEYVVDGSARQPYADAPDPFSRSSAAGRPDEPEKKSKKGWIIPVAALLALAMIAAAVYFLFLQPKDGGDDKKADSSSSRSEGGTSGEASSSDGGATTSGAIAGTYDVNGTIESYSGPSGQLGGATKKAGDEVFKAPQTWTLSGECTDGKPCELVITPGDAKVALTLEGESWKGQGTEQIACSASQNVDATVSIEIPKAGGTAKRTVSAPCAQPINEVDNLTLTKK